MIYENADPLLLAFIHDPLANIEALPPVGSSVNWRTRMFYKVPLLRRFIRAEQVQWLLRDKLKTGLAHARQTLSQHIFEDNVELNQRTMHRLTDQLGKYFNIGVVLASDEPRSDQRLAMLDEFIRQNTWARLEYTCNRIAENLGLRAEHNLSLLGNSRLWLCYYLSEVYFLMVHGLMSAKLDGRKLHIVPTDKLLRRLKGHWLAEISEANSKISDARALYDMALLLQDKGCLPSGARDALIDHVLDKCLSIHPGYLSEKVVQHPQYRYLREIVCFAAHIELRATLGKRLTSGTELPNGVSPATISRINASLLDKPPVLQSASSFIQYQGDTYIRGTLNFKYGLKKFVGYLLGDSASSNNGPDFKGALGKSFEADYIVNYIRNLDAPRFKVHDGFKAGNGSKIKGYDVDLVLQDQEEDIYYFIQIKYRLSSLPTYLSEQCLLFADPAFRKGFITQLATLRDNLHDESIRKKLGNRGLAGARAHNSHFILLHNIPFLNFYELDGIFFYEWNLLRNILRDGRVQFRKDQDVTDAHVLNRPRLHRPQELVDAYFRHSPYGTQLADQFDVYCRTHACFAYDDLDVTCKLI